MATVDNTTNATLISSTLNALASATGTVDATEMTSAQLDAVASKATKLAALGITGVMDLTAVAIANTTNGQDATELTALFGKDDAVADAVVTVTAADSAALNVLATNALKIASISGAMAFTSSQSDVQLTALLGKEAVPSTSGGVAINTADDTAVATGMTSAALNVLAANTAKIAANGISGVMALTSGQSDVQLGALFGKESAVTADDTVVATGMTSLALDVLALNTAKIAATGITGVMALTSGQDSTELTALFSKDNTAADDTVVATGMNAAALNVLAANTTKIATLSGVLTLNNDNATTLTTLFTKEGATATADDIVNAADMATATLDILAANTAKIASITGVMALTSGQDSTELTNLFSKDDATTNDTVVATGMNSLALNAVAANTAKIANAGISGVMALTSGQNDTQLGALFSKDDATTNDTVVATGMTSLALNVVAANTAKIADAGISGVMALTSGQNGVQLGALFSKEAAPAGTAIGDDTVVATGMTSAALNVVAANTTKIGTLSGVLNLDSTNAANLGTLFTKEAASADDIVNATGMDSTALNLVAGVATTKIGSITGVMGLTAGQSDVQLTALFGKEAAPSTTNGVTTNTGDDTVVATGMNSLALNVLAANTAKIANAGISGVMALTGGTLGQNDTQLGALFSKESAATADDTVVATNMTSAALNQIAANTAKIADAGISGVMALTSGQSDTQLGALFSKDDATADATVNATGMSSAALNVVADNTAKINTLSGVLNLDNSNAANLGTLFTKETASSDDIVNAANMNTTALDVLAANTAKIASITGVMTLTSGQDATDLTALFSKDDTATAGLDTVIATGMETAALDVLALNTAKIGVINGTMALTSGQNATELTALFSKDDASANDTVVATSMDSAALNQIAANIGKINATAGITGVMALTSGQNDTQLNALFSKDDAGNDTVNAAGMTALQLNAVAANTAKIDAASITGVMALTSAQNDTQLNALFSKDDATNNDTVVATGMNALQLNAVAANTAKIAANGISGVMNLNAPVAAVTVGGVTTPAVIGQDSTALTNLFSKDDASANDTVNARAMNSASLDVLALNTAKIASISGVMALTSDQDSTELTALFSKDDTVTEGLDTVVATGMNSAALDVLALNTAKIGVINGTMALTGLSTVVGSSGQDATELTNLFSKDDAPANDTVAVVAATSSAVLNVIAANVGKIANYVPVNGGTPASGGITGAMTLTSGQNDTQLNALFSKDDAGNDTVVATGMTSLALNVIAGNTAKIAVDGISGVMALTSGQNDVQLGALFSKEAAPSGTAIGDDTVVATGMSAAALNVIADNTAKIGTLSGVLNLNSTNAANLGTLFTKETASADDIVNATGMDSTALNLVAGVATTKIGSITGVMGLTAGQSDVQLTALFGKEAAPSTTGGVTINTGDDTVVATNMTTAALDVLALNVAKIQTITGTMALTSTGVTVGQDATELTSLFSKDDGGANDTIAVAAATPSAILNIIAANAGKIANYVPVNGGTPASGGITGAMTLTSGQSDSQLNALFSKDDTATAGLDTVVATGMNSAALNAVAANTAKIAANGISGVMALTGGTLGQNDAQLTALFSKEAAPAGTAIGDDTVVATGMNSAALDVVAANTVKIASLSGELALTSGQSDVELTALFGKEGTAAPADDTVNATGVSSAALNVLAANATKIASITGVLGLSGQSDVQLTTLFGKEATNAPADDIVNVTGMNAAALNILVANTAKIGNITGVLGLSGQNDVQLTALFNKEATNAPADDIVDVTGMNAAALNVLIANAAKIESITGVMSLNAPVAAAGANPAVSGQNATQLSALFDKESDATADDIVNATGMNTASLNVLAANSAKIGSITGSMALSTGQADTELSALFSKDDGIGNDTIVVTGMNATTLGIVATNITNIKTVGLTGVMAVDNGLSATHLTALFRKTGGAPDDTVNAADLDSAKLSVIAANTAKIATAGISGVMDLSSDLNASQLTNLFSKDDNSANDVVLADDMDSNSLDVLALNTAKIDTIDGVMSLTAVANGAAGQDATELTRLFSKDDNAANDTVDVTSATPSAVLNVLAANTAHIDDASITGVMALTSGQDSTALTNLFSKDDADANDTVVATGMNSLQLNAVAEGADHIADESITGVMALTSGQNSTALTNLFGKDDAVANATVNATGMNPAAVDVIALHTDNINTLTGALTLTGQGGASAQDAEELTALLGKYTGTTASAVATGMNPEALNALASTIIATPAKIKAAGISGEMALTSAQDSTELTKLFSKDDATADAIVNASGMATSALNVIASNAGKIATGGISGVMDLDNSVNAANLTALFGLDEGGNTASDLDMVIATGMNSESLGVLAVNTANIGEIRGAMTLTSDQDTTAMGDLFSKDDNAPNDIVIADGMDSDQLNLVALHTAKIDSIDGVMALTSRQDASTFTTLFSKDDTGENDTVVATDLHEELNIVAEHIDKVARITGDLGLSGQNAQQLTALFSKYSGGTTAVVNAEGMDADALNVVALNTGKIAAANITGEMHLTSAQDAAALTALFGKDDATDNDTVSATGMDAAAIAVLVSNTAKIHDITGELTLSSGQNSTALTKLFALDDDTANDVVDATGMNAAALHVLTANTGKIGSIFGAFNLDNSFTADEIAALDHLYVGEQLVEVDAATMTSAQQAAIETPRVATHHITHLALDLGNAAIDERNVTENSVTTHVSIGVNLLAKAAGATVFATNATPFEIHNGLVMNIANVTGITGDMHLAGDADTTAALAELFTKYTGTTATVAVTPDTDSAALNMLAGNTAKIDDAGITGVMALTGGTLGQDSTALTNLFSKDDATANDIVDATGMDADAIAVIADNTANIAHITGELTLFSGQDSATMTALFGLDDEQKAFPVLDDNGSPTFTPVDSAGHAVASEEAAGFDHFEPVLGALEVVANDIIDATGMVKEQLDVVADHLAKVDHIEGAMPLTSGQGVLHLTRLFGKYTGNTAVVDAANLDAAQLSAIAHNIEKIAVHGITGVMALTSAIEVPMLTALFTKDDTTADATVNATGMNAEALNVLAGHTANIDAAGITGELALSHAQSPDDLNALLALYGGTSATIDATDVLAGDLLDSLGVSGNPAKIATITGVLSLTSAQDATALTTLFAKDDDEANDVVNVSGMDAEPLNVVADNIDKIAHINGDITLVHGTGTLGQNADQLSALFSKYEGTGHATVDAAGMTADELNVLAANADKIAHINGVMALTDAQDAGDLHLLFSKDDATADATVDATGMDAAAVQELASNHAKIDTDGITGTLTIDAPEGLVPDDITHLFGKTAAAATVSVNASHMDNAEVDAVVANLAKVDNFIIGGIHTTTDGEGVVTVEPAGGAVIHAADITGLTLKVTGSANGRTLTVNGTEAENAETINLSHVTLSNAVTSIVGGDGVDTITLRVGSGTDIVILSSTDTATDSITGFNKSHVVKIADKVGFDALARGTVVPAVVDGDGNITTPAIMINNHGVTSVKLGVGTGDVVITSAVTTVATNATTLDAAGIAAALAQTNHKHLVLANADNLVYIAIDNGTNTAIARIDSTGDSAITEGEITVVGTLVAINDATSLNATNFIF